MWWFFFTCGGNLVHSETEATASLTTSRQSIASARKHKGKIANGVKQNIVKNVSDFLTPTPLSKCGRGPLIREVPTGKP
jgi:hypothetical protein